MESELGFPAMEHGDRCRLATAERNQTAQGARGTAPLTAGLAGKEPGYPARYGRKLRHVSGVLIRTAIDGTDARRCARRRPRIPVKPASGLVMRAHLLSQRMAFAAQGGAL